MRYLPDLYPDWTFTFTLGSSMSSVAVAGEAIPVEVVVHVVTAELGAERYRASGEDLGAVLATLECLLRGESLPPRP